LLECTKELIFQLVGGIFIVERDKIPNVLQVLQRIGRQHINRHCGYFTLLRCRSRALASGPGIPRPRSNCSIPRSIFWRTSESRCCLSCPCSSRRRKPSRITSEAEA